MENLKSLNGIYGKKISLSTEVEALLPLNKTGFTVAYAWILLKDLGETKELTDYSVKSRSRIDQWHLSHVLRNQLSTFSWVSPDEIDLLVNLVKILIRHQNWFKTDKSTKTSMILRSLFANPEIHDFLHINRFKDVLWFNSDNFDKLVSFLGLIALVNLGKVDSNVDRYHLEAKKVHEIITKWTRASKQSNYQVEKLLNSL